MWITTQSAPTDTSARGPCRGRNELFVNDLSLKVIFLLNRIIIQIQKKDYYICIVVDIKEANYMAEQVLNQFR